MGTSDPVRVVIIDDAVDLRELMNLVLTRGGYSVVGEAADGLLGIDLVHREQPDVIILDLSMPSMNGIEALPILRELVPHARIIVLSAFGASQMTSPAMLAGADGFIQKGASLSLILEQIREITAGLVPRGGRKLYAVSPDASIRRPEQEFDPRLADSVPEAQTLEFAPPEIGPNASAVEALNMSPVGVVEVAEGSTYEVVFANTAAQRLLGSRVGPGASLARVAPGLTLLLREHAQETDASFAVSLAGGDAHGSVRRTGWSLLVYLESHTEDLAMLRRAIGTTAHDVRAPVAVISGVAETLRTARRELTGPELDGLMDIVSRQAHELDVITGNLLTAAQLQRGTVRIDLSVLDPTSIVETVVRAYPDLEVTVRVDDTRSVRADAQRLTQMLDNLIHNAVKHGSPPFAVQLRPDGDHVLIDVIDHGPGVAPEAVGRLFDEYIRGPVSGVTQVGLGLFVVKALAQAQRADVRYLEGDERGSVFSVSLPAVDG